MGRKTDARPLEASRKRYIDNKSMTIHLAAEIIFWLSVAALFYAYVGYPLLLLMVSTFGGREVARREDWTPTVSVIITAYNEERALAAKLEINLALAYDRDKPEVLVAS